MLFRSAFPSRFRFKAREPSEIGVEAVVADEKKRLGCPEADVIALGRALPNGDVMAIRHKSDHTMETGILGISREGEVPPPGAEMVQLKHRAGNEYEVTETVASSGPPMVNSSAYRSNWDTIFGGRQTVGQA